MNEHCRRRWRLLPLTIRDIEKEREERGLSPRSRNRTAARTLQVVWIGHFLRENSSIIICIVDSDAIDDKIYTFDECGGRSCLYRFPELLSF